MFSNLSLHSSLITTKAIIRGIIVTSTMPLTVFDLSTRHTRYRHHARVRIGARRVTVCLAARPKAPRKLSHLSAVSANRNKHYLRPHVPAVIVPVLTLPELSASAVPPNSVQFHCAFVLASTTGGAPRGLMSARITLDHLTHPCPPVRVDDVCPKYPDTAASDDAAPEVADEIATNALSTYNRIF